MESSDKQRRINENSLSNLIPFKPGQSGNPAGRPKNKTIKEMVREWLEEHPEDMQGFVQHFAKKNRELAWQMLEGRPQLDVTSAGEKIETAIYVPRDDSPEEDKPTQEAN